MLRCILWQKLTDVSEVLTASIIKAIIALETVRTSETSVNFYHSTWRNILEDSHIHTRRRKNLKSHLICNDACTSLLFETKWLITSV
jgi:hypothetical protein